ncbi:MAG TPA: SAM-dependent methyltransferase [Bdellovibrionales bacterium]|nr:SAM-dependent methyltransferase [Bdellovibrionales bacterium]
MKVALSARDFERPLLDELGARALQVHERLVLFEGADPVWAQNLWLDPQRFTFKSIGEAAKHLRFIQRNWVLHSVAAHRRAKLIEEALPPIKFKALEFLQEIPRAALGAWTLLDENTLLYSPTTSHPLPNGEVHFNENKTDPPSRAYLKLWELFTVERIKPRGKVLDLGSSPGGWTWVLDQVGCDVISVDKAPLDPKLKLSQRVSVLGESAFGLEPRPVDWLFSDIICYPERLLELVKRWQGFAQNFVCTIKLQGPMETAVVAEFQALPGGRVRHLFNNKNELTFTQLKYCTRATYSSRT